MEREILEKAKKIHCIGIGGIGLSAIARMMLHEGREVSGSDGADSELLCELRKEGVSISIGHDGKNVPSECDLVVYSVAIRPDNPELAEAKKHTIPLLTYPEALGYISREKKTIAISGTHGKTTTTAMTAKILIDAGLAPTVIVGSLMEDPRNQSIDYGAKKKWTNFISGSGKYLIVEADEYRRAFLNLEPFILGINNIDEDHLDYYKDLSDIQDAFRSLVSKVPRDGFVVTDTKNPHITPVLPSVNAPVLHYPDFVIDEWKLRVPGLHNRKNAQVAGTIASELGISREVIQKSLESFEGAWRRFEYKGRTARGALVYDDYAHNPPKVRAALAALREKFPNKKGIVVFQPHLYSRTKQHMADFRESFADADYVILAPIFAAREAYDPTISSKMLGEAIQKIFSNMHDTKREVFSLASHDAIVEKINSITTSDQYVIMTVGAGDIYLLGEKLVKK